MKEVVRAHVVLPRSLVEAVDQLVGQRQRSRFVEEAVEEKLARERQREAVRALKAAAGVLNPDDYPYWSTPDQTSAWVHDLRRQAAEHAVQKAGRDDAAPA